MQPPDLPAVDCVAHVGELRVRQPLRQPAVRAASPVWLWAGVVGVCVLAVNFPVLDFDWVMFDDDINILVNPHLGRGAFASVRWAFQDVEYMRRYLPVGWLGFAGLLAVDGYNAAVFHAANWLLTAFNASLAFMICHRLGGESSTDDAADNASRRRIAAGMAAALLWSLHPLRVENVAWISGFLYVASTTFALGAVWLHLRATATTTARDTRLSIGAALLYLASCLVYPVFLALPMVIVWWSAITAPDSFRKGAMRGIRHTLSWWVSAAFVAAMNLFALVTASAAYRDPATSAALPFVETIRRLIRAVVHYLTLTIWPDGMSVYYGAPSHWRSPAPHVLLALVALVAVAALISRSVRRALLTVGISALLTLAPFLAQMDRNFHPSDRYAILWLAVFAIGIAMMLNRRRSALAAWACFGAVGLAGLLCSFTTRQTLLNWSNTRALQACIDRTTSLWPDVQLNFARPAVAFWWLGNHAAVRTRLQTGQRLFPSHPALAQAEARVNEFDARWRQRVPAKIPPIAVLHVDLGRSWLLRGEGRAAEAHFVRALRLAPEYHEAAIGLVQARGYR